MRVVSMINGSLLSESASYFALAYAQSVDLPFTALFIDNGKESEERVSKTVAALTEMASVNSVEFEFVKLEGAVVAQIQHFCQLYAVDTLFCATRKQSSQDSFSREIVKSGIETDIAVVKVKNVAMVHSSKRILMVSKEKICPHAFVMWLGLIRSFDARGWIHLAAKKAFSHATTKSGLKYLAAPFMQLARLSGFDSDKIQVVNSLQAMDTDQVLRYVVEHSVDLLVLSDGVYTQKACEQLTDKLSVNAIVFHPWRV
jgi:hypothetical protein